LVFILQQTAMYLTPLFTQTTTQVGTLFPSPSRYPVFFLPSFLPSFLSYFGPDFLNKMLCNVSVLITFPTRFISLTTTRGYHKILRFSLRKYVITELPLMVWCVT